MSGSASEGRPSVSAVIPAHDEARYVDRFVPAVKEALEAATDDWELIVVDDASRDGTAARVEEVAAGDPRIRVLRNPENLTLGGTLRRGFFAATKDLVFYTDADLPFDVGLLGKAVRLLRYQQADLVSAYRFHRTQEGPWRWLMSCVYNGIVRLLLHVRVRDVNFSFKLFRRALLQELDLRSEGSFIDAELVAKTALAGHHVIQFGVDYFPRAHGVSSLSGLRVVARIIQELLRHRRHVLSFRRRRRAPPGAHA